MLIWTLAKKDLRLLLGDRRALVILLAMPVLFIVVLGIALGEQELRVSIVKLDEEEFEKSSGFPPDNWSERVVEDLRQTAGIRVEFLSLEQAQRLINTRKRAAVLVFGPGFSREVARCSFLEDGINPFDRNGINLAVLDAALLRDETQGTAGSIIEQVAQVTLLRVVLPWMIGRAFEKIGDKEFMDRLGKKVQVPTPLGKYRVEALLNADQKRQVGRDVQGALQELYPRYQLTAKTWEALTRSQPRSESGLGSSTYLGGTGLLRRGDIRYQNLVPSYTVMFAFFLVLTVGWLFVAERRQGTLKRLRAAPLSRSHILFGKMVPCYVLSVGQGLFLLLAGKLVFGMNWGSEPLWLVVVVLATSLAATGLALVVAGVARTEAQVAVYGTLLVLVLAGVSGCLMGDPELMPDQMKQLSRITPHAWALDGYSQLLLRPEPNLVLVAQACAILTAFGAGFVALAWWFLKLD